jgi:hypothetical protein
VGRLREKQPDRAGERATATAREERRERGDDGSAAQEEGRSTTVPVARRAADRQLLAVFVSAGLEVVGGVPQQSDQPTR